MDPRKESVKNILDKYDQKLKGRVDDFEAAYPMAKSTTREYGIFKEEATAVSDSLYERACNSSEKILGIDPKPDQRAKLEEAIKTTHLNITPRGAMGLATLSAIGFISLGILVGIITFLLSTIKVDDVSIIKPQIFLAAFFMLLGVGAIKYFGNYPIHLATKWRLRASNQMVLCILYIVVYMRHTSNLEHAIQFASQHVGEPLAADLKRVLWNVETNKFPNMEKALQYYLGYWKKYNMDFVESMNLISSSLYEGNNKRRIELLEKALEVILEGTYENMLHFAQSVKSPVTMLHMFGIILPLLGLIILPLLGSFLGVSWFHLALVYNITLPIIVFFFGYNILSKRPMGYSQSGRAQALDLKKTSMVILIIFFLLVGFAPLIFHSVSPVLDNVELPQLGKFLDYQTIETEDGGIVEKGPFGTGVLLFSLIIPLGIAFAISSYYKKKTKEAIKIREETKKIEEEFRTGLFQLGNRIGGGIPAEMAFGTVARNLSGTSTGNFLGIVDRNIRKGGMNIRQAIFNERQGAILYYPSSLIESSMRVLVESARKGPKIVSQALISIATYLDRIKKVNERLKDLLTDIISSMKAQMAFLTPVIAGVVVGIGSMITGIMSKLGEKQALLQGAGTDSISIDMGGLIFDMSNMISPFFFQLVVGLYVVEIVYVLSILSNGIENGVDKLAEEHSVGKNLYKGAITYVITAFITILVFSLLAAKLAANISL